MPTSAIDSAVFRHIFGTEQMRKVWSDENRTQRYLDIEAALARAHRDTPMAGRSNLQQAVPITFGFKMATLLAAFM
jgi:adenylosuccinate lyase